MPKLFKDYQQQVNHLRQKGLTINYDTSAIKQLASIGYFSLICGYKQPFKNPTTRQYRDGVTFSDIVALYYFDEELRRIFLFYLIRIEKAMKSHINYEFCKTFGEAQAEYLNANNYNNIQTNQRIVTKLITVLGNTVTQNSDYPYINHHRQTYGNVPLWVLMNTLTFGNISKMFQVLPQSLQSRICQNYKLNIHQTEQILSVLTKFRNVCAHGERLYSYVTRDDIPDY